MVGYIILLFLLFSFQWFQCLIMLMKWCYVLLHWMNTSSTRLMMAQCTLQVVGTVLMSLVCKNRISLNTFPVTTKVNQIALSTRAPFMGIQEWNVLNIIYHISWLGKFFACVHAHTNNLRMQIPASRDVSHHVNELQQKWCWIFQAVLFTQEHTQTSPNVISSDRINRRDYWPYCWTSPAARKRHMSGSQSPGWMIVCRRFPRACHQEGGTVYWAPWQQNVQDNKEITMARLKCETEFLPKLVNDTMGTSMSFPHRVLGDYWN